MIRKTNIKQVGGRYIWRSSDRDIRRILTENYTLEGQPESFRFWLIARLGRPMERALIRAEQRYQAIHPARLRASALHRAYRARR